MTGKRLNWRRVKINRSYTLEEVARLLGVHKQTVRNWAVQGLEILASQKPHLIRGAALRTFLDNRKFNQTTGKPLSKSTVRATLAALRALFIWLAGQPGFRYRFTYSDADYFNPSERDVQIALSSRARPVPTIEQIRHALNIMPAATVLEKRDRALIAFILLTGCRDRAAVSVKLKHIDLAQRVLYQDPREVETKRGKTITTYFFPVGDEILVFVCDWIRELKNEHLWGPDDPLFPSTEVRRSEKGGFRPIGLKRAHWSNADAVRRVFKQAFEKGLACATSTLTASGRPWCG
jgi:integrase